MLVQRGPLIRGRFDRLANVRLEFQECVFQCRLPLGGDERFDLVANFLRGLLPGRELLGILLLLLAAGHRQVVAWQQPGEKGLQSIVVDLRNRIELVIVTLGTTNCQPQEGQAGRIGQVVLNFLPPLPHVGRVIFVGIKPIETRGN